MLDKHCAFVTFVDWKHAGDAMRELQGLDQSGCGHKLLIKYPDRALDLVAAKLNHSSVGGSAITATTVPTSVASASTVSSTNQRTTTTTNHHHISKETVHHPALRATVILRKSKK